MMLTCRRCSSKTMRRSRTSSSADCARRGLPSTTQPTATPGSRRRTQQPYDVAIVDLMLPKRDGLSLIEELRRRGVTTPVLILSARRSVDDRVRGLQAGGDDYLTKPFAFAELLARVQALVRRATRAPEPTTLTVDDLVARSAVAPRHARRHADRSAAARVRAARIPDAQRRPGRVEDDDPVARVGIQLRPADQHRRRAGQPAAREDRSAVREEAAAHRARCGVCPPVRDRRPCRVRSACASALWYATLFVVGVDRDRRSHLLPDGRVAGAARSADHPRQARRLRGGVRARRRRACSPTPSAPSSRRRPSGCSCASSIAASKRSC